MRLVKKERTVVSDRFREIWVNIDTGIEAFELAAPYSTSFWVSVRSSFFQKNVPTLSTMYSILRVSRALREELEKLVWNVERFWVSNSTLTSLDFSSAKGRNDD